MTLKQKVDKSFLRAAPADKVQLGQHVVDSLNAAAASFPNLPFSVDDMKSANTELNDATAAAKSGSHTDIALRNSAEKKWNDIWSKTADYVSFLAAGNALLINKSGFTPTSGESTPSTLPAPAVMDSMTQHEGGVAEVKLAHPGAGKVTAYLYMALPADASATTAADGTITLTLAGGEQIYLKCDTHTSTTMGGMKAGKMLKMMVQPINNKGAGGTSAPKSFTPQP